MSKSRFVIGIDLGTTNTVLAYAEALEDRRPQIATFAVPQLVAAGTVETRPLLPSFLYLPGEHELGDGALTLPWGNPQAGEGKSAQPYLCGEFARTQGELVSDRLVHSSKSWLCHEGVDRRASILPWGSEDVAKVSPVEAARRLLLHLKNAWDHSMAARDPSARFELQDIILTVPASFDAVARELTVEAAKAAGIPEDRLVLLEEPQAAFYAWLGNDPAGRQGLIQGGDKVLVVDMGGGTTDLSLFSASVGDEDVQFERTAVGEHLLLGGDNIDLAIARLVEADLKSKVKKLSVRQWQALLQSSRAAKERLLADESADEVLIRLPGKGSKLLGKTLEKTLTRAELMSRVLDGFFPEVTTHEEVQKRAKGGLHEYGLPFEADPAVTRHLRAFLADHGEQNGRLEVPRALLFNGGVFKTEALRSRVTSVLSHWMAEGGAPAGSAPLVLHSDDLDLAVAHGAAYYGLVRRGYGVRIRGGLPRSYYIGIETGAEKRSALCLIPRGLEEGETVEVEGHDLDVVTRRPVGFPLYTSTTREEDKTSDLVTVNKEDFRELPPLLTVLKLGRKSKRKTMPVRLRSRLTEIGTLELTCQSRETEHAWRLDFTVRSAAPTTEEESGPTEEERKRADEALRVVRSSWQSKLDFEEGQARLTSIVKRLEEVLGAERNEWSLYSIRRIWDEGLARVVDERSKTPLHEARWLNLAGFCLRPGFGEASDDHRLRTIWKVFLSGATHANDPRVAVEWLVCWRRCAGGLTRGQQEQMIARMSKPLKLSGKLKGHKLEQSEQAWRLAASLENLPAERKAELGEALLKAHEHERHPRCLGWALGRIGARIPIYGTIDNVISPKVATRWIEALLEREAKLKGELAFGLVQLARVTGDRSRDIEGALRDKVSYRIKKSGGEGHLLRPLNEAVAMVANEQSSALGDTIPTGLKLASR